MALLRNGSALNQYRCGNSAAVWLLISAWLTALTAATFIVASPTASQASPAARLPPSAWLLAQTGRYVVCQLRSLRYLPLLPERWAPVAASALLSLLADATGGLITIGRRRGIVIATAG